MCKSEVKLTHSPHRTIDGRAVLQPTCNCDLTLNPSRPLKKCTSFPSVTPPNKRDRVLNSLSSSIEKPNTPKSLSTTGITGGAPNRVVVRKKAEKNVGFENYSNGYVRNEVITLGNVKAAGSLAAARRQHDSMFQAQRKTRIACYGRVVGKGERKFAPFPAVVTDSVSTQSATIGSTVAAAAGHEEKRCYSITANSDGRAVLQPTCNCDLTLNPSRPLKKCTSFPSVTPPNKRDRVLNSLSSSIEKPNTPKSLSTTGITGGAPNRVVVRKKAEKNVGFENYSNGYVRNEVITLGNVKAAGSLAAARRQHDSMFQAQRKTRIACYGRVVGKGERKFAPFPAVVTDSVSTQSATIGSTVAAAAGHEEKRCYSITANSDPLYVAYHDEEWGVPVHDDKMLFELLVLSGAQAGLDWTAILKKRDIFRSAFVGFDAEEVSKFSEKQITSTSVKYDIDLGRVRGVVDNACRILEVIKEFGSLDQYVWGFINYKPISTQYRSCRKIPVKTSKSDAISRDMVRLGFRFVGPTIIHSFMQAAGLTNDHLVTCPRHSLIASTS